jgi:RNA polymerase sigma-70 factor (ECF subfamily)
MKAMHDHALAAALTEHRALLFALCYRMTGCAADADDLVQETFARALVSPPSDTARELRPWLVRVAMNLSRDHLRRRKRLAYAGPWLPSPIETPLDGAHDRARPDVRYGELESLSMAFLIALEALSATQRAVLILRDVLGYSVEETAEALELSDANVKQIHHRARAALERYEGERVAITPALKKATHDALNNLLWCLMRGDVRGLEKLLAEDVRALNDGNNEFFAAKKPVVGRDKVILFHQKTQRTAPMLFAVREINGLPALVAEMSNEGNPRLPERMVITLALNARGEIQKLDAVVATRKLTHLDFDFYKRAPRLLAPLEAKLHAVFTSTRAGRAALRAFPALRALRGSAPDASQSPSA